MKDSRKTNQMPRPAEASRQATFLPAGSVQFGIAGVGASHGQRATDPPPTSWGTRAFEPEYICAIYIKMENNKIMARHAYVPFDKTPSAPPISDQASYILDAIKYNDYRNIKDLKRVSDNFHNFSFNSMQYLVFAVDNNPNEIDFFDEVENGVIQFTASSALNIEIFGRTRQQNFAFFNLVPITLRSSLLNNNGYLLEYWNTNPVGAPIDAYYNDKRTHWYYSMNIHMLQGVGTMPTVPNNPSSSLPPWPTLPPKALPIIIDPDVGNNGGDP